MPPAVTYDKNSATARVDMRQVENLEIVVPGAFAEAAKRADEPDNDKLFEYLEEWVSPTFIHSRTDPDEELPEEAFSGGLADVKDLETETVEGDDEVRERDRRGDDSAADRPPTCVRWLDDENGDGVPNRGVLEVEVSHPLVEWMQLEADARGVESIAEWARNALFTRLEQDLMEFHGGGVDAEYTVPDDLAVRARLLAEAQAADDDAVDVDTAFETAVVSHAKNMDVTVHTEGEEEPTTPTEAVTEEAECDE